MQSLQGWPCVEISDEVTRQVVISRTRNTEQVFQREKIKTRTSGLTHTYFAFLRIEQSGFEPWSAEILCCVLRHNT